MIIKINGLRGDLSDVPAKTTTLMYGTLPRNCSAALSTIQPATIQQTEDGCLKARFNRPERKHGDDYVCMRPFYKTAASTWTLAFLMYATASREGSCPVFLFPKLNKIFFGYFDPENIFLDNKNK